MNATLRGSKAVKHRAVLRSRRLRAIARWWDVFASYVLVYDAAGHSIEQSAQLTNMPERDVELILYPQPPNREDHEFGNQRLRRQEREP